MTTPRDERDLESELLRIYEEGGKLGYWAKRFYQMFTPGCQRYVGGVAAVRKVLEAGGATSGLTAVVHLGRQDLAVEELVLGERWGHLFKPWDCKQAQENLRIANAAKIKK
jgi:hypothetical protein